jgi:hypothetical protein
MRFTVRSFISSDDCVEMSFTSSRDDDFFPRRGAIALYGQMVGSLLLSRAVTTGNPKLADEILRQTRAGIFADLSKSVRGKKL